MSKPPNRSEAILNIEKLTDYCLNLSHPTGKQKAKIFREVLGVIHLDADLLRAKILEGLDEFDCTEREADQYGQRFSVDMKIRIFGKEAIVTTGWILRTGESSPRLTSCYINAKKNERA